MSSPDKTHAIRWAELLANDDGEGAVQFLKANKPSRDESFLRLTSALAHSPFPERVLRAFMSTCGLERGWLVNTVRMDLDGKVDWAHALDWRFRNGHRSDVLLEMQGSFGKLFAEHTTLLSMGGNPDNRLGRKRQLMAMLEVEPTLASGMDWRKNARILMDLALDPVAGDWLARSGLPVEQLLRTSIRDGFGAFALPLVHDGAIQPGAALEHWLKKSPAYRNAWDMIEAQDLVYAQAHDDWFDRWVPGGAWEGSALQQWCETESRGKKGAPGPTPLDHDTFSSPWPMAHDYVPNLAGVARKYQAAVAAEKTQGFLYFTLLRVNNSLRRDMAEVMGLKDTNWSVLHCPMSPVGMGLYHQQAWAKETLGTPEGVKVAQDLMAKDKRVMYAAADWPVRHVADWILENPSWKEWRNNHGQSLLDVCMSRGVKRQDHLFLPKATVLRLAKAGPELLTNADAEGRSALDRLEIPDATKSAAKREMLKRQTSRPARKTAQGRRAL